MLKDRPTLSRPSRWDWILWWRIDPEELENQVADYQEGILHTARGWSLLMLAFSDAVTTIFVLVGWTDRTAYVDCAIMLTLGAFIYFGHRWAMLAAMVLWTIEKIVAVFGSPASIVAAVLWWATYMHAFWLAFHVERARARQVFDLPKPEV
jgi:hypothetical protein